MLIDEAHEQQQQVGGRCEASRRAERVGQREDVDEPAQGSMLGELSAVPGHASLRHAPDQRPRAPSFTPLMSTPAPADVPFEPCRRAGVGADEIEDDQADDGGRCGDARDRRLQDREPGPAARRARHRRRSARVASTSTDVVVERGLVRSRALGIRAVGRSAGARRPVGSGYVAVSEHSGRDVVSRRSRRIIRRAEPEVAGSLRATS